MDPAAAASTKRWCPLLQVGRCSWKKLILPQEPVPTVLDALRNHPTAGYLGVTKTLQKV